MNDEGEFKDHGTHIEFNPDAGTEISRVVRRCISHSSTTGVPVHFYFNGIPMMANSYTTPSDLITFYHAEGMRECRGQE